MKTASNKCIPFLNANHFYSSQSSAHFLHCLAPRQAVRTIKDWATFLALSRLDLTHIVRLTLKWDYPSSSRHAVFLTPHWRSTRVSHRDLGSNCSGPGNLLSATKGNSSLIGQRWVNGLFNWCNNSLPAHTPVSTHCFWKVVHKRC